MREVVVLGCIWVIGCASPETTADVGETEEKSPETDYANQIFTRVTVSDGHLILAVALTNEFIQASGFSRSEEVHYHESADGEHSHESSLMDAVQACVSLRGESGGELSLNEGQLGNVLMEEGGEATVLPFWCSVDPKSREIFMELRLARRFAKGASMFLTAKSRNGSMVHVTAPADSSDFAIDLDTGAITSLTGG